MSSSQTMQGLLSDVSCRILTVSTSIDQAVTFIDSIRWLKSRGTTQTDVLPSGGLSSTSSLDCGLYPERTIPWTISNKYYSADVHFYAREVRGLARHHVHSAPAVIFVWAHGEAYREHILRISEDFAGREPEVSLAVRTAHAPEAGYEGQDEEDNEIDEFLSSHGFEFIDGRHVNLQGSWHHDNHDEEMSSFDHGIPGLSRVVDSLSTIMWPSMKTHVRSKAGTSNAHQGRLLEWATGSSSFKSEGLLSERNLRIEREAENLVHWLEGDPMMQDLAKNDPWRSSNSVTVCASPTSAEPSKPLSQDQEAPSGFDDDFTVFVTAPISSQARSAPSTPSSKTLDPESPQQTFTESPDVDKLSSYTGALYTSLGSATDLVITPDNEKECVSTKDEPLEDDDDDNLPTREEIAATAARIFGIGQPTPLTTNQKLEQSSDPKPTRIPSLFSFESILSPQDNEKGDEGDEMAPFDLSRVLSALQGMKAEIANMQDESERKRAAARVALGLVYGLEAEAEDSELVPDQALRAADEELYFG